MYNAGDGARRLDAGLSFVRRVDQKFTRAMEPEAPWAVDPAIKSRTGNGAPAGVGTITPDNAQVLENASYLALDAYKFDIPNAENFLPRPRAQAAIPRISMPPTPGRLRP